MKYFITGIFLVCSFFTTSIYTYTVHAYDGSDISFSGLAGKKILVVNIATGSDKVGQLRQLQLLQDEFADSLVVVGFSSNSFGNENRNDLEIQRFCRTMYGVDFLIAAKGSVKGESIQPIYAWLTQQGLNGSLDSEVKDDFQKYLIDEDGHLLAVFAGRISPLDNMIKRVISGSIQ